MEKPFGVLRQCNLIYHPLIQFFLNGKTFRGIATLLLYFFILLENLPQWKNLSGYCDCSCIWLSLTTIPFLNGKTFRGIATQSLWLLFVVFAIFLNGKTFRGIATPPAIALATAGFLFSNGKFRGTLWGAFDETHGRAPLSCQNPQWKNLSGYCDPARHSLGNGGLPFF